MLRSDTVDILHRFPWRDDDLFILFLFLNVNRRMMLFINLLRMRTAFAASLHNSICEYKNPVASYCTHTPLIFAHFRHRTSND